MITEDQIKVKITQVYLSAQTKKGNYGQCYSLTNPHQPNYVKNLNVAKQRFMKFYNQFE